MPTPWEELVYMAGGDEDRAREVADLFDLRGVMGSKLADLSSGERRRLAIASAYLGGFDVYLLDEPTGGLDAFNANRVVEVVERLVEEGKTVVIASHDDRLVRAVERRVVIDRGVVV
jgi:energy-coupling factor transport system ATP-binding protein